VQRLIPRKNKVWVFGAWYGQRFSDNSRYLFEYVNKEQSDVEAIWITRDKELKQKIMRN
jgi:CDP-glycerol glycerophosphotransferase